MLVILLAMWSWSATIYMRVMSAAVDSLEVPRAWDEQERAMRPSGFGRLS